MAVRSLPAALTLAAVLAACTTSYMRDSGIEREALSDLTPLGDGRFAYTAGVWFDGGGDDARNARVDDPQEGVRLKWLRDHLDSRGMCPEGFEITRRTVDLESVMASRVHYRGRCAD